MLTFYSQPRLTICSLFYALLYLGAAALVACLATLRRGARAVAEAHLIAAICATSSASIQWERVLARLPFAPLAHAGNHLAPVLQLAAVTSQLDGSGCKSLVVACPALSADGEARAAVARAAVATQRVFDFARALGAARASCMDAQLLGAVDEASALNASLLA